LKEKTVGNILFWAYANLAMAHVLYKDNSEKYTPKHYGIRSRLYKGLSTGEMNVKSFFDDERLKMILPQSCNYCGSKEHLAVDHLISRKKGGLDIGENLVWACRTCNSSKSDQDLLEWMNKRKKEPSILLYRRYLKNVITYCRDKNIINENSENALKLDLPFNLSLISEKIIPTNSLKLWITEIEEKTYRIANWNLERPKNGTKKTKLALEQIEKINADILLLTETSDAINLEPIYNSVKSIPFDRNPNEQWITIWSKWKIKNKIETFDNKRTTCALIKSPFGNLIIYGTIIPYHMAGVSGNRYDFSGYKPWELHKEDIIRQSDDWKKIQSENKNIPFLVIGDFNQTRDDLPKGYGTISGRELLTEKLKETNLICVTNIDFAKTKQLDIDIKKGKVRRNIDHICISKNWLNSLKSYEIGAWNNFDKNENYMSDHNGVYLDFEVK